MHSTLSHRVKTQVPDGICISMIVLCSVQDRPGIVHNVVTVLADNNVKYAHDVYVFVVWRAVYVLFVLLFVALARLVLAETCLDRPL